MKKSDTKSFTKLLSKDTEPQGIETPSYIRIVVAPIGNISRHVFMKYLTLIQTEFTMLPIYSLTRFTKENQKSPFARQNWKTAKLHINYLFNSRKSRTRDHRSRKSAIYRSAYEDTHCFLGIVSCRNNLKEQYVEYEKMKKSFPHLKSSRLLAVEYQTETQTIPTEEEMNKLPDLIVILPAVEYTKLRFYVERAICDLMNSFVKQVEKMVPHPDRIGSDIMKHKIYAEHALLVGDLVDSGEIFRKLQRLTNKDAGLLALSKIGLACHLIQNCRNAEELNSVMESIINLYEESFILFQRKGMIDPHLIEGHLRLSNFCNRYRRKEDAVRYMTFAVFHSKSGCKTERSIHYLRKAADLCVRIGCERKRGMVLMMLAEQYHELNLPHLASQMVFRAFGPYKIPFEVHPSDQNWKYLPHLNGEGWKEVQIEVIKRLVYQYSVNDALTRARLIFFLLSRYRTLLSPKEQTQYFRRLDRLCSGTGPGIPSQAYVCLSPLPILRSMKAEEVESVPKKDMRKEENGVFIFVPDSFKKSLFKDVSARRDIKMIKGEVVSVEITFYNPFHEVLKLTEISLRTSIPCCVYSSSASIKPRRKERVTLQMVPEGVGVLRIQEILFFLNSISNRLTVPCEELAHRFLSIEVLEPIPLLQTNFTYRTLTLHEGETIRNQFDLKNLSELAPVTRLEIRCVNDKDGIVKIGKGSIPELILPGKSTSVTISFLVKEGIHRNFKRKQFLFEVKYGIKDWVRKLNVSLWVSCLRNLKIRRDDKFIRIQNTSNESFLVYLKNGMTLSVPPNHSKILFRRELKRWQSQDNLFVSASTPTPTSTTKIPRFGLRNMKIKRNKKNEEEEEEIEGEDDEREEKEEEEEDDDDDGKLFFLFGMKRRNVRVLQEVVVEVDVDLESIEEKRRGDVKMVISSDPRVSYVIGKSEINVVKTKGRYSVKVFFLKEGKFVINVFLVDTLQKIELESEKILVFVKYSE